MPPVFGTVPFAPGLTPPVLGDAPPAFELAPPVVVDGCPPAFGLAPPLFGGVPPELEAVPPNPVGRAPELWVMSPVSGNVPPEPRSRPPTCVSPSVGSGRPSPREVAGAPALEGVSSASSPEPAFPSRSGGVLPAPQARSPPARSANAQSFEDRSTPWLPRMVEV